MTDEECEQMKIKLEITKNEMKQYREAYLKYTDLKDLKEVLGVRIQQHQMNKK